MLRPDERLQDADWTKGVWRVAGFNTDSMTPEDARRLLALPVEKAMPAPIRREVKALAAQ